MKLFSGLIGLVILAVALLFALNNRQSTSINLWPFGVELQAPLFLLTLGTLFFGVMVGSALTWFGTLPHRLETRRLRKEMSLLNDKITQMQQTVIPPQSAMQPMVQPTLPQPKPKRRLWGLGL